MTALAGRSGENCASKNVDVLLVNPPSPDGGIWIRSQHRVGRRSREGMVWPQCSLAQLAAMLQPQYTVAVIDAIAAQMTWQAFENELRLKSPKYYLTHSTASTLTNDLYGIMLAKSLGAKTITFGTHATPMSREMMLQFPALDFIIRGEPELTLRELIDTLEARVLEQPDWLRRLLHKEAPGLGNTPESSENNKDLSCIKGLVWRDKGEILQNQDREFIPDLDALPLPSYNLLPLDRYRMPLLKGPFCFVVTSRGCPEGCKFCIKHVSYGRCVRLLSPERVMSEIRFLHDLGIRNIHMYADLFTVDRNQVIGLCRLLIHEGLKIKWTCNSRIDYVDQEMLEWMGKAGCWMISWGIESGNEGILKRAAKGINPKQVKQALVWARSSGIKNWGYFIIGLPGETIQTIRETIAFAKELPLDLALFHLAAPYPGTPFYHEVVEKGWLKENIRWEQVDMDKETVLQYDNLSPEDLQYWQRRAFRAWAFRPGPAFTFAKMLLSDLTTLKRAARIGFEHLRWTFERTSRA